MTSNWARVSIRFATEQLTREEISALLDLEPSPPVGHGGGRTPWILECPDAPDAVLEEQLNWVRSTIEPRLDRFAAVRARTAGDVFVGWAPRAPQDSLAVPAEDLALIGRAGLDFVLDLYAQEDEEDVA